MLCLLCVSGSTNPCPLANDGNISNNCCMIRLRARESGLTQRFVEGQSVNLILISHQKLLIPDISSTRFFAEKKY